MGKKKDPNETRTDVELIDARIEELADWRGQLLSELRALIKDADPDVIEEWKWGVPVWSHAGVICTGEAYKAVVKLTFMDGASVEDPAGLFNASLEGNKRRAIDVPEGGRLDEKAFKALIRSAVAFNEAKRAG
ncbi:MAG: hypothetical protein JWM73_73 [Solirubrobacterales bacterium]|jgi:hypothetical protein|nr:hypothetical protein [Solirubrobacterales bacterium]